MIFFWSLIVMMVMIAMLIVIIPLFSTNQDKTNKKNNVNILVHKDRLQELEQEFNAGLTDAKEFAAAREEIEAQVLTDVSQAQQSPKILAKINYMVAVIVILAMPAFSLLLYQKWGDSKDLAKFYRIEKEAPLIKKEIAKYKNPQQLIAKMKMILEQRPDSARGWFLLGRLYIATNQYQHAEQAFATANKLKPNQPGLMMQYAEAIFFANHKHLNTKGLRLVKQVLEQMPNNPSAVNLLALNAYSEGHYQQAINYWQQLLDYFPPQSNDSKAILMAIANAQKKMNKT